MLAKAKSANYSTETGQVTVILDTSTMNGYPNTVDVFFPPQTISMPADNQLVDLDVQSLTQMQINGFSNKIIDANYTLNKGEHTTYSDNWYLSVRNGQVEIQQAQSANKEAMMMGVSTNALLIDIQQKLEEIVTYLSTVQSFLSTHTHSAGGLTSTNPGDLVTGISGSSTSPPPASPTISPIDTDLTYTMANKNLVITGTYTPHV